MRRRVRNSTGDTLVAQPATMPLATTDAVRLTEQQEEIERTREQETRDHHERMLQVRLEEQQFI